MNLRLALVFGVVCILATVSARPAENDGLLSSILASFQRHRRQDVAPSAAAAMPKEAEVLNKEPTPVPQDSNPQPPAKVPEGDFFTRQQQRISDGVNTVVKGAMGGAGSLEQILRGSFSIPSSARVRDQASGVLDSIFGGHK